MASHFRGIARDDKGNTLDTASVYVYETGTTNQVSIFEEEALTTPIAQPIETDSNGNYEFWAAYQDIDILVSLSGFTSQTVSNLQLGNICDFNYILDTVGGSGGAVDLVNAQMSYGNMRIPAGGTNDYDLNISNGWVLINSDEFTAPGFDKDFTYQANGRLRYDGATTKNFRVTGAVELFGFDWNTLVWVGIGINGSDPVMRQGGQLGDGTGAGAAEMSLPIAVCVELATNEYIELYARSAKAGVHDVEFFGADIFIQSIELE